jgi:pimeloyl-ACP methyl ester carboxylesterase
MKIVANNIRIEFEDTHPSDASRPLVLLIMGLGMQLTAWPPYMVQALVDAGFRVLRLDNRDIGLSQHFDHLGKPNMAWAVVKYKLGLAIKPPYTLHDMAQDTLGLLDALGVTRAHVVGASMGGMIAQRLALLAPGRVISLHSIMSSSGARGLPAAQPHVLRAILQRPKDASPSGMVEHYARLFGLIGSPGFATDPALLRERIAASLARCNHPVGTLRQMLAVAADTQRAAELTHIQTPTLVLHGKADPLVPYACGEDTARRIAGARLVGIEGMGHDLPPGVVQRLLQEMIPFMHQLAPTHARNPQPA